MNQALAIVEPTAITAASPAQMIQHATEQAKVLAEVIEKQKLYNTISGRKFVRVEGWVPLARFNGVIPKEVSNEEQEDGRYIARVQLVRIEDGAILTEASAECGGPDEQLWNKRAPYARRSMAATRATGKACRLAFSWIMVLSGFEATPAEEMDGVSKEVEERQQPEGGVTFAKDEPCWESEYPKGSGSIYLWVVVNGVFTEAWAKEHGFKQSKNPAKWSRFYDHVVARQARELIDGKRAPFGDEQ